MKSFSKSVYLAASVFALVSPLSPSLMAQAPVLNDNAVPKSAASNTLRSYSPFQATLNTPRTTIADSGLFFRTAETKTAPDQISTESGTFYMAPLKAAIAAIAKSMFSTSSARRVPAPELLGQNRFQRYTVTDVREYSALEDWKSLGMQMLSKSGLSADTLKGKFHLGKNWELDVRFGGRGMRNGMGRRRFGQGNLSCLSSTSYPASTANYYIAPDYLNCQP